ncbi:Dynein light chain 4, axonemal [Hondaea fermentalgiana]|uniref:Dynein light chain 4, axonemal n=1 Tax=Hondaea fermentalgiana TaxID=2315210 RepID=A0A2R5G310_9STRA|nr:Dynein light chain 4, axonemal [Hondaea fermentalgiana]|eukprot:GBG24709.1 Dynein light chain 4, axonemal [Hondaea fermentalgiana]
MTSSMNRLEDVSLKQLSEQPHSDMDANQRDKVVQLCKQAFDMFEKSTDRAKEEKEASMLSKYLKELLDFNYGPNWMVRLRLGRPLGSALPTEVKMAGSMLDARVAAEDVEKGEDQAEQQQQQQEAEETTSDDNWLANYASGLLATQSEAFFVLGVCLDSLDGRHASALTRTTVGIILSGLAVLVTSLRLIRDSFNVLAFSNTLRPELNGRDSMAVNKVSSTFFMAFSAYLAMGYENAAMRQYSSLLFLVISTATDAVALVDVWRDRNYYFYILYGDQALYDGKPVHRSVIAAYRHALDWAFSDTIACTFCFLDFALNIVVWVLIFV